MEQWVECEHLTSDSNIKLQLSASIDGDGYSVIDPTWETVEGLISELSKFGGSLSLTLLKGNLFGEDHLEVRSDRQQFILSYLLNTEDDDAVYCYMHEDRKSAVGTIEILGDFWDAKTVFKDKLILESIFKTFLEKGKISLKEPCWK